MRLIIKLSERLEAGIYKATEIVKKRALFYAKTKGECIAKGREYARLNKKASLRLINNEGREIYKTKFFYRENLKL